jgi:hypothetical protein
MHATSHGAAVACAQRVRATFNRGHRAAAADARPGVRGTPASASTSPPAPQLLALGCWASGDCGAGQRWRAGRCPAHPLTRAQPVRATRCGSLHSAPDTRRPCGRRRVRSCRHAPAPPHACGRRSRRAGVHAQPWAHEPRPKRARLATTQRASDVTWRNARSGLRAPARRAHSVAAFERTWTGSR